MTSITDHLKDGKLSVRARPGAPRTEIVGWDDGIGALRVNIKAPPEDNKANIELLRFFTKLTKKKVTIVTGHTSKTKVLRFE